jgi:gamma-glutamyltranspeptidase/glutathione hydrolase
MAPPSSGGTTVAQALNMLETTDLRTTDRVTATHRYLEASRLAFADRGAYVADPAFVPVPVFGLLSKAFARERAALIGERAGTSPASAGNPWAFYPTPGTPRPAAAADTEGTSTTHLTVSDRRGNVVSYTFTIESTGGSGMVVPGRGFLLNNELTDFDLSGPNAPAAGKRPRSSMAPTIVTRDGRVVQALGSPGGSTIITTVLQVLVDRLVLGTPLPEAIAAPRASQRNTPTVTAEPGFIGSPEGQALAAQYGHEFTQMGEIGAATAVEFLPNGRLLAVAEPTRRGGGNAQVVRPGG